MKQMFGGILMAVGILIAGASGLCSLAVLFGGMGGSDMSMFPLVLLFGGPPFALGAAMAYAGHRMIQVARNKFDVRDTFD